MKRPGWLGGKSGEEPAPDDGDGGDGDGNSEPPDTKAKRKESAPGSSSREARRRLGERVGKGQPEPAARKRAEPQVTKPEPKPKPKPAKAKAAKAKPQRSGATPKQRPGELNRPRRRPTEEGKRDEREREREPRRRRRGGAEAPATGKARAAKARAAAAGFATALKRGGAATWKWLAGNAPKAARMLLAALAAVFALLFEVIGFVLNLLFAAWRFVARPVGAVLAVLGRLTRACSRVLTPARGLTLTVAGAAILLALSQYADYRSISIGNGAYADVQTLAPAPETGRLQAGDPHSFVFVPVAIACLLLLAVATIGGRWRACRLIALGGFAAIVVALLVDRPAGLDPGAVAVSFEGVRATLIGGFYAQIAAGVLLIGSSSLLARELRLAAAPSHARAGRRKPAARRGLGGRDSGAGETARA